jgi:hypothetical protein
VRELGLVVILLAPLIHLAVRFLGMVYITH